MNILPETLKITDKLIDAHFEKIPTSAFKSETYKPRKIKKHISRRGSKQDDSGSDDDDDDEYYSDEEYTNSRSGGRDQDRERNRNRDRDRDRDIASETNRTTDSRRSSGRMGTSHTPYPRGAPLSVDSESYTTDRDRDARDQDRTYMNMPQQNRGPPAMPGPPVPLPEGVHPGSQAAQYYEETRYYSDAKGNPDPDATKVVVRRSSPRHGNRDRRDRYDSDDSDDTDNGVRLQVKHRRGHDDDHALDRGFDGNERLSVAVRSRDRYQEDDRDRERPRSAAGRVNDALGDHFTSSRTGVTSGVAGALIGGWVTSRVQESRGMDPRDRKNMAWTAVGAAAAGLAVNAIVDTFEDRKADVERKEEQWEEKWGRRPTSSRDDDDDDYYDDRRRRRGSRGGERVERITEQQRIRYKSADPPRRRTEEYDDFYYNDGRYGYR